MLYMCVVGYPCTNAGVHKSPEEDVGFLGLRITGSCELPDNGART